MVDLDRIMAESPRALAADRELAAKYEALSQRLEEELALLADDEREARESELFGEYLQLKMDLEGLLAKDIDAAIDEVKRRRGIRVVVYRDAVKIGGVDITDEVIRRLD
jgi:outer membrane protein